MQRERKIARRLDDIRNIFTDPRITYYLLHKDDDIQFRYPVGHWGPPGKYAKNKPLDCSCWMCEEHYERHKSGWTWDGTLEDQ